MVETDTPDLGVPAQDVAPSTGGEGQSPLQSTESISSDNVTTTPSDQAAQEPPDPLKDVPTAAQVAEMQTVSREAFLSLRNEYDRVKPERDELTTKYSVFEPVADKFESAEDVQKLVTLNESLNKYSPDPDTGALRPDPTGFAQQMSTDDPERADYLASALVWGQTKHPATGQPVTRAELVLQVMANDPELRSHALQILGGVEPSAVQAPTWAPSQDELDRLVIDPNRVSAEERALQETYKKLSFEEREELKLSSPEFVKSTLRTIQQNQMLQANEERRVASEQQAQVQAEQRVEQEANDAGDQYVEQGFKEGLTNFANHIYETWKPTDDPIINKREGAKVALTVVALSHPDTRWAGEQMLKDMGVPMQEIEPLNKAREAYADAGRRSAYFAHKKQPYKGEDPSRLQQRMIVQAENLATKIIDKSNEYFKARATAHNDKLDQTERARIPVGAGVAAAGANGQPGRHRWSDL